MVKTMPTTESRPSRRVPAGAAVLQEDVTEAIRAAVFAELAAVGYGRMSIEAVARRAGVGKSAVYRRWRSKLEMVIDVVSAIAVIGMPVPDTGSLRGDVRALLGITAHALRHPLASQIVPDLLAEAARNPDIAQTLETALRETQRGISTVMVRNAVARGELPSGTDPELAFDMVIGPLYWRLAVVRAPVTKGYLDRLAAASATALAASVSP
jgi:AcrR family transcriptional regulator